MAYRSELPLFSWQLLNQTSSELLQHALTTSLQTSVRHSAVEGLAADGTALPALQQQGTKESASQGTFAKPSNAAPAAAHTSSSVASSHTPRESPQQSPSHGPTPPPRHDPGAPDAVTASGSTFTPYTPSTLDSSRPSTLLNEPASPDGLSDAGQQPALDAATDATTVDPRYNSKAYLHYRPWHPDASSPRLLALHHSTGLLPGLQPLNEFMRQQLGAQMWQHIPLHSFLLADYITALNSFILYAPLPTTQALKAQLSTREATYVALLFFQKLLQAAGATDASAAAAARAAAELRAAVGMQAGYSKASRTACYQRLRSRGAPAEWRTDAGTMVALARDMHECGVCVRMSEHGRWSVLRQLQEPVMWAQPQGQRGQQQYIRIGDRLHGVARVRSSALLHWIPGGPH